MNNTVDIQELAIVVATKNHNPAILNPDFLKYSGIVPDDWELARQPVNTNHIAQVTFQNGVNIVAQPGRVIFSEPIVAKNLEEVKAAEVARKYVETLPNVDYQGVGINLKDFVTFKRLQSEDVAQNYIVKTLLAPGPWQEFESRPVQAAIQLVYTLERCQCHFSVNQATLQLPEQETIPVVVFSANFNYEITESGSKERLQALCQRIGNWQADLETFSEIVNTKFLQQRSSLMSASVS